MNRAVKSIQKECIMKQFGFAVALVALSVSCVCADPPGEDISVYHIGNSLIRNLSLDRLAGLFKSAEGNYEYGSQLSGGRRLYAHLADKLANGKTFKRNNIQSGPYGDYLQALQKSTFDALVLQSSRAWLTDRTPDNEIETGDVEAISGFIDYATGKNPAKHVATQRFYVYGAWPGYPFMLQRKDLDADSDGTVTYTEFWDAPTDTTQPNPDLASPNRQFLTSLVSALNERYPNLVYPVRLISVGDVFAALDKKIRAGQLPGLAEYVTRKTKLMVGDAERPSNFEYFREARRGPSGGRRPPLAGSPLDPAVEDYPGFAQSEGIRNVYADIAHMNDQPHNGDDDGTLGSYIASITFYAVLAGRSPVGLTAEPWERIDPVVDAELVKAVQETVWEVVSKDPLAGIARSSE
ncbi:MAG: hypothetical protein QF435_15790 [Arenicellales bacterium]|nr:hypothetical protein [Arenicellales bacterium]